MPTVRELATEHGCSPGLVLKALQSLAVYAEGPATVISDQHARRFRDEFGHKIKRARPKTAPLPDEFTSPPNPRRQPPPAERQFQDHIVRIAHDQIDYGRNMITYVRYPVLAASPGLLHAIDPVGTRDGDTWGGERVAGRHHFYEGRRGPKAACGTEVRALISDEFATDLPGACPMCRQLVEEGKAFRNPPRNWWRDFDDFDCRDYTRIKESGVVRVEECCLRDFHKGRHRSVSGGTWESGGTNYQPPSRRDDRSTGLA